MPVLPLIFLKAQRRGDNRTVDMFAAPLPGTYERSITRKDGVIQTYHVKPEEAPKPKPVAAPQPTPKPRRTTPAASHYRVLINSPTGQFHVYLQADRDATPEEYLKDAKNVFLHDSGIGNGFASTAQVKAVGAPEPVTSVPDDATAVKNAEWARIGRVPKEAKAEPVAPKPADRTAQIDDHEDLADEMLRDPHSDKAKELIAKIAGHNQPTPAAQPAEYRYALVNRPPGPGATPRDGMIRVDPRPEEDADHYDMARHGIAVYDHELTPDEQKNFELAPIVEGEARAALAEQLAQKQKYVAKTIELADEDPDFWKQQVSDTLKRQFGYPGPSVGDFDAFAAQTLERLKARHQAMTAPSESAVPAPATEADALAAIEQAKQEREKKVATLQLLEDMLGADPNSTNADAWRQKAEELRAEVGEIAKPQPVAKPEPPPVDRTGWSQATNDAYDLSQFYRNNYVSLSSNGRALGAFKRKVRAQAMKTPADDDFAVSYLDLLWTKLQGPEWKPGKKELEFAQPKPLAGLPDVPSLTTATDQELRHQLVVAGGPGGAANGILYNDKKALLRWRQDASDRILKQAEHWPKMLNGFKSTIESHMRANDAWDFATDTTTLQSLVKQLRDGIEKVVEQGVSRVDVERFIASLNDFIGKVDAQSANIQAEHAKLVDRIKKIDAPDEEPMGDWDYEVMADWHRDGQPSRMMHKPNADRWQRLSPAQQQRVIQRAEQKSAAVQRAHDAIERGKIERAQLMERLRTGPPITAEEFQKVGWGAKLEDRFAADIFRDIVGGTVADADRAVRKKSLYAGMSPGGYTLRDTHKVVLMAQEQVKELGVLPEKTRLADALGRGRQKAMAAGQQGFLDDARSQGRDRLITQRSAA